jgi:ribonucleoside-diphosphate reductase alpha chain
MYKHKEVLASTVEYFNGDKLAASVWVDKYCVKGPKGELMEKNPSDMHKRIAKELARIEEKYPNGKKEKEIFELLDNFKYIVPQGSPMAGIGNNYKIQTLSNCYVIENPHDSYAGVFNTEQEMVQLMKRRGGVGFSIHSLRPREMPTSSVSEKSSGLTLFAERYSNATREVAQDGRRGALMLSCRVDHPDIEDFVGAKLDLKKITGANVSIMITDEFMNAVKQEKEYDLTFIGEKGTIAKTIDAKTIWGKIIQNAHKSAEPGVLFWDTVHRESPAYCYGKEWEETSTNPCSELPLCPYDSCRLLVHNLYSYVENPFTDEAKFNFKLFKEHVAYGQRFMDDIIDLEIEKIDIVLKKIEDDNEPNHLTNVEKNLWLKIKQKALEGRRTGLGITAEGDMLAALGLRYGTPEATDFSELVHKTLAIESYRTSICLAKERGSFLIWDELKDNNSIFVQRILNELSPEDLKLYKKFGRRNIANLTLAPTGSVSLETQTTSGIEPLFLTNYKRRKKVNPEDEGVNVDFIDDNGDTWEEFRVFHHKFKVWAEINGYNIEELTSYSDKELSKVIEESPYYKATANDIDWLEKVRMQGKVQKWIDHSISVTVNVPANTTVQTVNDIYTTAWETGCKGMTIYRDGSRSGVMVSDKKEIESDDWGYIDAVKRPKVVSCDIHHITALGKKWVVLMGIDKKNRPYEVFSLKYDKGNEDKIPKKYTKGEVIRRKKSIYDLIGIDSEGNKEILLKDIAQAFETADERASTRRYSLMLRHKIHPRYIVSQINEEPGSIVSFNKAIARTLKRYLSDEDLKTIDKVCQNCGSINLAIQEKCLICMDCGSSKCG